jgi:hypothetical protein
MLQQHVSTNGKPAPHAGPCCGSEKMRLQASKLFGADFALLIVLAAMLVVGFVALAAPTGGTAIPATGAGTRLAGESQPVVHYRVDVIGVRSPHTAGGVTRDAAAQPGQPG